MTITQYRERIRQAKSRLIEYAPKLVEEMAVSGLSMVKRRSTEDGILQEGQPGNYAEYSSNTYATSFLKGKELNAGGRAYTEKNKVGNWAGLRRAQGMKADRVNLVYSSRMWNGLQVIRVSRTGPAKFTAVLGAADAETRKKLIANVARYGTFFVPTDEEHRLLGEIAGERMIGLVRDVLNKG